RARPRFFDCRPWCSSRYRMLLVHWPTAARVLAADHATITRAHRRTSAKDAEGASAPVSAEATQAANGGPRARPVETSECPVSAVGFEPGEVPRPVQTHPRRGQGAGAHVCDCG